MKRMRLPIVFVSCVLALGMSVSIAQAAPSVSVSNVVITPGGGGSAPVCQSNDTGNVGVTATVSGTFDSDIGSTEISNTCDACKAGTSGGGNNNCDTYNPLVLSKKTVVTQTIDYSEEKVVGYSDDNQGHTNGPTPFDVDTTSGTGNFGSLATGPEGATKVTVSAWASEREIKTNTTTITYWSGTGGTKCTGTNPVAGPEPTSAVVSNTTRTSTPKKTADTTYLVDKVGPTATVKNNPDLVYLGGEEDFHVKIENASSGTPYSVMVTATSDVDSTTRTGNASDTVGSSPDGITTTTNSNFGLPIGCSATPGDYQVAVLVKTQDLCGTDFPDITLTGDDFVVAAPDIDLVAQTHVISQLTNGGYGIDFCFVDSVKQQKNKLIVNNTPGSVHIGATVRAVYGTDGVCAESGTISGGYLKLTLPTRGDYSGFSYMLNGDSPANGSSPPAHIFIGEVPEGETIDYHYGVPHMTEVTDLVTQSTDGQTITINLSGLGEIPMSYTIFARAHAKFNATSTLGQPLPDTPFMFMSEAQTNINGVLTGPSTAVYYISGNPTQTMDEMTGALEGSPASCNADGWFVVTPQ